MNRGVPKQHVKLTVMMRTNHHDFIRIILSHFLIRPKPIADRIRGQI